MTSEAQRELWADSFEKLKGHKPNISLELVVPDLAEFLPVNSDGEPMIYARPWDTDDERAVARAAALDDPSGWVEVLIRKALDEHGCRIWHVSHRAYLETLPHDVIRRVAYAIMLGDPDPDPEVILRGHPRQS